MEDEPKPSQNSTTSNLTPNPNSSQTTMPPPQPQPHQTTDSLPTQSKKRPLETTNFHIENSNYFKMRAVLKDLRPHLIEVLRTPDFRNCSAGQEIRNQTKLLMEIYKQMISETITIAKCNTVTTNQPVSVEETLDTQNESKNVNLTEQQPLLNELENQEGEDNDTRKEGSYVVGGSAFGWNYLTFPSKKLLYYGVTKETFRSQSKS